MVEKAIFGSSSTPAALVIDLLRMYTTVVLAITASTKVLPMLDPICRVVDVKICISLLLETAKLSETSALEIVNARRNSIASFRIDNRIFKANL